MLKLDYFESKIGIIISVVAIFKIVLHINNLSHQIRFMKIIKYILLFFICISYCVSSVKAEHFFSINVQKILLDEYPKVKLQGVIYLAYVFEDEPWSFSRGDFTIFENGNKICCERFNLLDSSPRFQVFELSYISDSPLKAERKTEICLEQNGFHNGAVRINYMYNGQVFIFKPSGEIIIPEESLSNMHKEVLEKGPEIFNMYESKKVKKSKGVANFIAPKYRVTATNGLKVRNQPALSGSETGKLPYRSIVAVTEHTKKSLIIPDNGAYLGGNWVKIEYGPYKKMGYVFNGFLEPISEIGSLKLTIDTISYSDYSNLKSKSTEPAFEGVSDALAITDNAKIRESLKHRVSWIKNSNKIESFTNDFGQKISWEDEYPEEETGTITYYYPGEKVICLSDLHSDYSISLITGQITDNPKYISYSPNKKYKLAGIDEGQGGTLDYFFRIRKDKWYDYSVHFSKGYSNSLTQFYWINNNEFVCSIREASLEFIYLKGRLSFWPNRKNDGY